MSPKLVQGQFGDKPPRPSLRLPSPLLEKQLRAEARVTRAHRAPSVRLRHPTGRETGTQAALLKVTAGPRHSGPLWLRGCLHMLALLLFSCVTPGALLKLSEPHL